MSVLMEQGGLPPEEAGRIVARMLDKKRIRQRGGKPIEWTTINAWRKKIRARRRVTPEDADVVIYTNCRLPVALRTIIGWDKDGENAVLEPLPEPRTLAMEVLEFGLDYEKPLRLWGLDEVHE